GREHVIEVAEMVLSELSRGVALILQRACDGQRLLGHADRSAGKSHLGETGAKHALPGDERRAAGGAGLFTVAVDEHHALVGDAVDVGRAIAHEAMRVATEVRDTDVVAPDYENVRLAGGAVLAACV